MVLTFPGGMQMDLLWQNSNPSAAFAAQSVSLDLSAYRAVIIEYQTDFTGNQYFTSAFVTLPHSGPSVSVCPCTTDPTTAYIFTRYCWIVDSGINFASARSLYGNSAADKDMDYSMKPVRIYGVQF